MAQITVRIEIPRTPVFTEQTAIVTREEMLKGVRESLLLMDGELVKRTPVGVTGRMRSGWQQRVNIVSQTPVRLVGENINTVPYALYVDQGSVPHWPPWGPGSSLALWVQRKLGPDVSAFLIARKIARVGTKAQHIVRNAVRVTEGRIRNHFQQTVVGRIVRRLGGTR